VEALRNRDPQRYSVSAFAPSALYVDRPTYIYCGTILSVERNDPVGGIAVVFDAEPQFRQMLMDVLPRREDGTPYPGSFAAFINQDSIVISSTAAHHQPGQRLDLRDLRAFEIVARRTSPGYREFKRSDGYVDPVDCVIAIPG
jgi:hypothetical protein